MLSKKMKFAAAAAILLFAAACNLPAGVTPTPFVFPTPDLTLTAIFSPVAPTATSSVPLVATATQSGPAQATSTSSTSGGAATSTWTQPAPSATNTSAPTATSRPMNTSAPLVRGGTSIRATYMTSKPTIDGDTSEWAGTTRYDVKNVVFGRENWEDEVDLSGVLYVGWDDRNLYLAGRQYDDHYVQEAKDQDLYKGDSFEVLFDANLQGDFYTAALSPDDFQLGVSPGKSRPGNDPQAWLWFPTSVDGELDLNFAFQLIVDDYQFEVAIPWSTFEISPVSGQHYGFAFSLSDNDAYGTSQQQTMVSTAAGRRLTDPTTWGDLILVR